MGTIVGHDAMMALLVALTTVHGLLLWLLLPLLHMSTTRDMSHTGCGLLITRTTTAPRIRQFLLLDPLFQMDFRMTFLLIGSRKLPATNVTRKWLLSRMSSDVSRQVIRTRK